MTWRAIPALMTISLLVTIVQLRWIRHAPAKERSAFWSLLALCWLLASLLMIFPRLPGLTELVDTLMTPIGDFLIHGGTSHP
ncbi:hypothetical protein [Paenibacillus sp. R14(2021)]|uniref:hypothetical protein n=1 Tax=Paenibacillus sp. R14(2021) TaxID=2859228 RepID=UPI001C613532|nr:hypothetical protein [Paenibacillus sp. R14(2021)]